ncbi:hypothetical protein LIER_13601 [Lithospermum erythrorhizon]|uniref:Uncharacterized protein n=1 Tax=Lithospermum erythrorhizon TaxID=34254 RepID=A0AAV3Q0L5_LITER
MFTDFVKNSRVLDLGYASVITVQLITTLWVGKEGCEEVVKSAWSRVVVGSRWFQVSEKIKFVRMALIEWCKKNNVNSILRIEDIQTKLKNAYKEGGVDREVIRG